ncbi:MAG: hypothetical protein KGJ80_06485, partial [Chloroflexota bacterium]|nr:hypothetical protein [Chloroflexota bacterium]
MKAKCVTFLLKHIRIIFSILGLVTLISFQAVSEAAPPSSQVPNWISYTLNTYGVVNWDKAPALIRTDDGVSDSLVIENRMHLWYELKIPFESCVSCLKPAGGPGSTDYYFHYARMLPPQKTIHYNVEFTQTGQQVLIEGQVTEFSLAVSLLDVIAEVAGVPTLSELVGYGLFVDTKDWHNIEGLSKASDDLAAIWQEPWNAPLNTARIIHAANSLASIVSDIGQRQKLIA